MFYTQPDAESWFERGRFMRSKGLRIAAGILTVCFVALPSGQAQDKVKVKGLITTRTGETIVLKTAEGTTVTVVVDENTKVQQPKGLGLRKENVPAALLIPGLRVSVDGTRQDPTHIHAKSVTFHKYDLQMAEMVQAGVTPTEQKVATNQQNIETNAQNIEANTQNIKANEQQIAGTQDQEALKKLAQDAISLKGYIIQVKGFTDSRGGAALNQKLSMERAQSVIAYLIQDCNVPVYYVVAPGAMGETAPVASNDTKSGRAENRRVEVRVLVDKGIAGT